MLLAQVGIGAHKNDLKHTAWTNEVLAAGGGLAGGGLAEFMQMSGAGSLIGSAVYSLDRSKKLKSWSTNFALAA